MIQRIQSVFLLIMAICMVTILFVPIWGKGSPDTNEFLELRAFSLTLNDAAEGGTKQVISSNLHLGLLAIVSAVIALISIFQFSNRKRQMMLGLINAVTVLILVVSMVMAINSADEVAFTEVPGNYLLGFMLPVVGLLFNSLANRFIRRDEKLVRDSERLR